MLKARRSELLLILSALMFASNGIAAKLLHDDPYQRHYDNIFNPPRRY
jgi:hypothetical protein